MCLVQQTLLTLVCQVPHCWQPLLALPPLCKSVCLRPWTHLFLRRFLLHRTNHPSARSLLNGRFLPLLVPHLLPRRTFRKKVSAGFNRSMTEPRHSLHGALDSHLCLWLLPSLDHRLRLFPRVAHRPAHLLLLRMVLLRRPAGPRLCLPPFAYGQCVHLAIPCSARKASPLPASCHLLRMAPHLIGTTRALRSFGAGRTLLDFHLPSLAFFFMMKPVLNVSPLISACSSHKGRTDS